MPKEARTKWLKNIFLTYPQCPVPPRCLLDFLIDLLKDNLDCCCISQELHQDGNQHLHAFVQLKERITLSKEQYSYFFDLNYGEPCFHPNVQSARNVKNVVKYVVKGRFNGAMQDFIEHNMSAQAVLAKKNPKSDTIAKMLAEGKTTDDCFELVAGILQASSAIAPINMDNRDRFVVLYDFQTTIDQLGSRAGQVVKKFRKTMVTTAYNAGAAGTVADIASNSIYLLYIYTQIGTGAAPTVTPAIDFYGRWRFDDS